MVLVVRHLKKRLGAQLKCTYKGRDVKFVVGCYNAFTKNEGRRVVPISASIFFDLPMHLVKYSTLKTFEIFITKS